MNGARWIAYSLVALTGALIVGSLVWAFNRPHRAHYDVDREAYPVKGIDVSAHNGLIDFDSVRADSVRFVLIKATEGTDFCDAAFERNYNGAKEAGLKVGPYHFFRFDSEGWRQGRHFLETIEGRDFDMPLVIDVEEWGNADNFSTAQVVRELRAMVDYLHGAGRDVMLYTNKSGYNRFIRFRFSDTMLWLCTFSGVPQPHTHWTLWQHSHRGRVAGVEAEVDLNTFNGSDADWERWLYTIKR